MYNCEISYHFADDPHIGCTKYISGATGEGDAIAKFNEAMCNSSTSRGRATVITPIQMRQVWTAATPISSSSSFNDRAAATTPPIQNYQPASMPPFRNPWSVAESRDFQPGLIHHATSKLIGMIAYCLAYAVGSLAWYIGRKLGERQLRRAQMGE